MARFLAVEETVAKRLRKRITIRKSDRAPVSPLPTIWDDVIARMDAHRHQSQEKPAVGISSGPFTTRQNEATKSRETPLPWA